MGKEIVTFGNNEFEKQLFHSCRNPISIYDINIDKIVVSRFLLVEKVLNILLGTKIIMKKLSLNEFIIEEIPMKLIIYIF